MSKTGDKLKKIAKSKEKHNKIPIKATELHQQSTDNETPVFSFKHVCDKYCQLSNWQKQELSLLIGTFKTMESLYWKDVRRSAGLNMKPVTDSIVYPLPHTVPADATIQEVKVDDGKRLFGYRAGRVFCIIWFDRNHEVIPYHKPKKKRKSV